MNGHLNLAFSNSDIANEFKHRPTRLNGYSSIWTMF